MSQFEDTEDVHYGLQAALAERARYARPDVVETQLLTLMDGLTPAEAESFASALGDVGRFVKSNEVRGFAGAALPVIGTAVGGVYGGPIGASVGTSLGSAAAQAFAGKPNTTQSSPASSSLPITGLTTPVAAQPSGQVAGAPEPTPSASSASQAPTVGSPAAAQLLSVVHDPAFLTSLIALLLGPNGKTSVPIGNTGVEVPVGAMMNLIGVLANRAAEDAEGILAARENEIPAYLVDEGGCLTCDPAVPTQRADALLNVLRSERDRRSTAMPCSCAECTGSRSASAWF